MTQLDHRFSIAPMMDWTDRHCRYFLRLISRRALLYSEMVPTGAIVHGDRNRYLGFSPQEHPVALQLGGAVPKDLVIAARAAEDFGYDEVNLNIGCPSDRVQKARFGACLMAEPSLVADCVAAMGEAVAIPVTVKTRIGIDEDDSYDFLCHFVAAVAAVGCRSVTVHARKAWLKGLSPKQNREVPPLNYQRVYDLKRGFPDLEIILNGGVQNLDQAAEHLGRVDGVMLGRAAYQNPYILAEVDRCFFNDSSPPPSRAAVVRAFLPYVEAQMTQGVPLKALTRHILGLFSGQPGGKLWRRYLSENAHRPGAGPAVIEAALEGLLALQDRQAA